MESKAKKYERQAKEADEKAETVHDTEAKQAWRDVAPHGRFMAVQAKQRLVSRRTA